MMEAWNLLVAIDDFNKVKLENVSLPPIKAGQAMLGIERYALTANNVSYAASGDELGFWKFFSAPQGWGRIPVWGYGEVIESTHPDLKVGERLFGYFPMSTHVVIDVALPTHETVSDGAPQRQGLAPVYNLYQRALDSEESYKDLRSLAGPLFLLSFVLDDELKQQNDYNADAVILLSASSKTAIGTAHLLSKRSGPRVIGLTAKKNVAFVQSTRFYDRVVSYDEISTLADEKSAVSIDMTGNASILRAVHETFGDRLLQSILIGLTHYDGTPVPGSQSDLDESPMPGPEPWFFFGPDYIERRIAEWGEGVYKDRVNSASADYLSGSGDWLGVTHADGPQAAINAYKDILAGRVNPSKGIIVRP